MSYFYKELLSISLCFILFILIVPIIILTDSYHDGTQRFDMFVKIFNKSYHQNVVEYDRRLRIFQVHNLIIHNNCQNVLHHLFSLCVKAITW